VIRHTSVEKVIPEPEQIVKLNSPTNVGKCLHGTQGQIDKNIDGRISLNDCCCSRTLIGDAHLTISAFLEFLFFTGKGKKDKSNLQEIHYFART